MSQNSLPYFFEVLRDRATESSPDSEGDGNGYMAESFFTNRCQCAFVSNYLYLIPQNKIPKLHNQLTESACV